jgi:sec-independent protein translocase protein TatC
MVLSTYLLIPITWYFFLSFQNLNLKHSFNLHFEAKLKEYLNFYISSYFLYLFYFQFFIFLILFLNYTNFNIKKIKKFRKFNYYCLVVLSTAISPPEVLSQLYVGLFIILVYELSLFIYLFRANY